MKKEQVKTFVPVKITFETELEWQAYTLAMNELQFNLDVSKQMQALAGQMYRTSLA